MCWKFPIVLCHFVCLPGMSANDVAFSVYAAHTKRPAWEEVRTMSVQLSANMQELLATYRLSKAEL